MTQEAFVLLARAAPAANNQSGGLFDLAWGLFASVFGLAMVTNPQGVVERFRRQGRDILTGPLKRAPWMAHRDARITVVQIVGIPFMIAGPVSVVAGVTSISHGRIAISGEHAVPSPFRYLFIAAAVVVLGRWWLPQRGFLRPAARRGGWRLALAVLVSLGALVFGVELLHCH